MVKSNNIFRTICLALVIFGCESKSAETDIDTTAHLEESIEYPIAADTTGKVFTCYEGVMKKDTVSLNLAIAGEFVTGDLHYNFYEKDENNGILNGKLAGDTLFATYTFQSEGVESVKEVVFLTKNNVLHEGFGEVIEKAGKIVFKDKSKLKFPKTIALKNINCL